jgi:short-subunit dehydrogenase
MGRFQDQVVFITGASSGIGAALARRLAQEGAHLVLVARREDRLSTLAGEIRQSGRRALVIAADVTRDGDLERAAARAREELGKVDVVVANAGFGVGGNLERLTLEDYRRQFETNVFGVLRTVYATLDDLKRSRGRLVLVGSVSGYLPLPSSSAYAMSKAAVHLLSHTLRHELAPHGISVLLIAPGFVESEIRRVNNQGVFRPDAKDIVPDWMQMPADKAAAVVAGAIAARRREQVVTLHGKLGIWLQRHVPWLVAAVVGRASRRAGPRWEPE